MSRERGDEIPDSPSAATMCLSIRSTDCARIFSIPTGPTWMDREDVLVSGGIVGYLPALVKWITDPGSAVVPFARSRDEGGIGGPIGFPTI